jgi:hypothetical protein
VLSEEKEKQGHKTFNVTFRRTFPIGSYETISIGLSMDFDRETEDPNLAFEYVYSKVSEWCNSFDIRPLIRIQKKGKVG